MSDLEPRDTRESDPQADAQPAASPAPVAQPTRRALIASIGGLVGAAMAKAFLRPAEAEAVCDMPVTADCTNVVTATTQLDRTAGGSGLPGTLPGPVLQVDAEQSTAVFGSTQQGVAMVGRAGFGGGVSVATTTATWVGGAFFSDGGGGVVGVNSPFEFGDAAVEETLAVPAGVTGLGSARGAGVVGMAVHATGTLTTLRFAPAGNGIGVLGLQGEAFSIATPTHTIDHYGGGVFGLSRQGIGVFGGTSAATASGVVAYNAAGGNALQVLGPAAFSTIRTEIIPPKVLFHDVADPTVTQTSHITVSVRSPAKKLFVQWVELVAGFGYRLHLSKKQSVPVEITVLVFEQVEPTALP